MSSAEHEILRLRQTTREYRSFNRSFLKKGAGKLIFSDIATCPLCIWITNLPVGTPLSKKQIDHLKHHVARPLVERV